MATESERLLEILTPNACAWFPSLWRQRDRIEAELKTKRAEAVIGFEPSSRLKRGW